MRCVEMVNDAVAIPGEDRNRGILMALPVFASKIVFERAISGTQETQPVPATVAGVRSQGREIGCRDNREVDVLGQCGEPLRLGHRSRRCTSDTAWSDVSRTSGDK